MLFRGVAQITRGVFEPRWGKMPDPNLPEQFFDAASLGTFAGAAGATFVVVNTVQRAFGVNPAWFGLLVAECICVGVTWSSNPNGGAYIIAVLNGCLVYLSAAGMTGAASAAVYGPKRRAVARGGTNLPEQHQRMFLSSWFER